MTTEKPTGLALLRKPFEPHQIGKLPKPTKKQTEEVRQDYKKGIRCKLCGAWHHPDVVHLDYVGHAALTDRLLECDPKWNWEPMAIDQAGAPLLDQNGGMWIKLTVCDVTRLGYGDAEGKRGGSAVKEVIGDALRNAAMRFGAALDLWHKGDLHVEDTAEEPNGTPEEAPLSEPEFDAAAAFDYLKGTLHEADDMEAWKETHKVTVNKLRRADQRLYDQIVDLGKKRSGDLLHKPLGVEGDLQNDKPLVDSDIPF